MGHLILVINPGSTSTKLAIYQNDQQLHTTNLHHSNEELNQFSDLADQKNFRKNLIINWLAEKELPLSQLTAIVARGGLLAPVTGGTYYVNDIMVEHLREGIFGKHASNLAGLIAFQLGKSLEIPAFIVDPVVVDELSPVSRLSGSSSIKRQSIFHALNHKASAKKAASFLEQPYDELNLIVAHLGGGISIAAHRKGKVIDVNNALSGEGPFSPERTGSLPPMGLVDYFFKSGLSKEELIREYTSQSGLVAYLGSNDLRLIEQQMDAGNEKAQFYFEAMALQIAKEIGKLATVFKGIVDGIVLTGGLAHSNKLIGQIRRRVEFIAPLIVLPGENELEALALGALRVLTGEEQAREYMGGR